MSTPSAPVLELAAFMVRARDAFPAIQHHAHDALATLRGYRTSLRLRGVTDGVFADLVAWDSLEEAQSASATLQQDRRFAALLSSIAELRLYAHYRLDVDPGALLFELRRAPVVEVAAYPVRDVDIHLPLHGAVHEALRSMEGYRGGAPARQIEDSEHFADLIGWDAADAHRRAGAALQGRPNLAPFFSGIREMNVFELFSVLG